MAVSHEQNESEPFFVVPDALTTPTSSSSDYISPYPPQNLNEYSTAPRPRISEAPAWSNGPSITSPPAQEACGSFPGDLRRPAACLDYSRCPKDAAGFPILCKPAQPLQQGFSDPSSLQHHSSLRRDTSAVVPNERPSLPRVPSAPAETTQAPSSSVPTSRPAAPRPAPMRSRRDFAPSKPGQRVPHNLVERRYRDNLNAQIEDLRTQLPSLAEPPSCGADVEDIAVPPRIPSKAVIISTAVDYIQEMKVEQARLLERQRELVEQVEGLQRLVKCDDCSVLRYLSSLSVDQGMGQP